MKRLLLLLFIGIAAFLLIAFFKNPDLLDGIWLWLIGFAGVIVQVAKKGIDFFKSLINKPEESQATVVLPVLEPPKTPQNPWLPKRPESQAWKLDPSKIQISLLRFHDDTQTSLGLLYINNKFYCYTLEDAHHAVKIPGKTRIPCGIYNVGFQQTVTDLTKAYRERYPDWFKFHIQIEDVPGFGSIYIHNGGDHTDTEGCILVSDSMNVSDEKTYLSNSKKTFKTFYQFIEAQLLANKKITITIKDEIWIDSLPA